MKRKSRGSRILALIMSLLLAVGLFPQTVLAGGQTYTSQSQLQSALNIQLTGANSKDAALIWNSVVGDVVDIAGRTTGATPGSSYEVTHYRLFMWGDYSTAPDPLSTPLGEWTIDLNENNQPVADPGVFSLRGAINSIADAYFMKSMMLDTNHLWLGLAPADASGEWFPIMMDLGQYNDIRVLVQEQYSSQEEMQSMLNAKLINKGTANVALTWNSIVGNVVDIPDSPTGRYNITHYACFMMPGGSTAPTAAEINQPNTVLIGWNIGIADNVPVADPEYFSLANTINSVTTAYNTYVQNHPQKNHLWVSLSPANLSGAWVPVLFDLGEYNDLSALINAPAPEPVPEASIDYIHEVLTKLDPEASYKVNGADKTADKNGCIAIESSWMGQTISIVKKGGASTADSEPQSLPIPSRPAAPGDIATTDETALDAEDGTITGVASTMEYRMDETGAWTPVTGATVTGLAPGNYYVRYKATEDAFASENTPLTIEAVNSITFHTNGGTINEQAVATTYTYGTTIILPRNVTKENAVFENWYSSSDLSGQPVMNINGTDRGNKAFYAKWVDGPSISTQPTDAIALMNENASFSVSVESAGPGITYQWQRLVNGDWTNIEDATSVSLLISNVTAAEDGAQFRCVVTNTVGEIECSVVSAVATLKLAYSVEVNTWVDGTAAEVPGAVTLNQGGNVKATAANAETGTYTTALPNGSYNISIDGKDTGKTVSVSGGAATVNIHYYSLSFSASDSGLASGSTVTAKTGEISLISGKAVLAGTQIILTATGGGANSYTYLWSGNGTNGQDTKEVILTVNSSINALCTITGSASYSVTLNAGGGAISSGNVTTYTYGNAVTLPANVTLANATFAGWYADSSFTGEPVTQISATDAGNKTYYAKWVNTVIFSNNYTGAPIFATQTDAIHGAVMSFDNTPERTGYIFAGWYKDAACLNPWSFSRDRVNKNLTLYARWITTAYSITGKVVDDKTATPSNISGAAVKLMQGNTQFGDIVTTDINGNFELTGVPNGTYNLVASKDGKTVTVCVIVKNGSYDFGSNYIVLPEGNKSSILDVKGNDTPSVVVDGLNSQFTSADATVVGNGNTVKITLEVENKGTIAPGADKLQTAASGKTIDMYLDMTVFHQVNSDVPTLLTTVPNLLKIIVPYDLSGKSNVTVYRYHGGSAQAMTSLAYSATAPASEGYMLDTAERQIIIWARNFSTYAVAYGTGSDSGNTDSSDFSNGGYAVAASYSITVPTNIEGGSISPNGTVSVTKGGSKTFAITPDKGYTISDVLVDGKSVGAVSSYTLTDITGTHTISAVFAKIKTLSGLPYYYNEGGKKVFIGFATAASGEMKYIAPAGRTVLFQENPKNFADISGHWGKSYIDFATEREIFVGTSDRMFSPDEGMTRAMLATVIGRLYERSYGPLETKGNHAFNDCDYNSWYGSYVDWCAEKGIIQGVGDSKFEPERKITRQEMAVMLYRFAVFMKVSANTKAGETLNYSDTSQIGAWAQAAALYCQQTGIITGRNGSSFAPKETATRAEVAVILNRFIEIAVK